MIKVALYARVSTKDKDQNPETQLLKLREYCKRSNYEIYKEYVDKVSGARRSRPEFDKLMNDARLHYFDKVIVTKLDRFGRSAVDLLNSIQTLDSYGINFVCVDQPIDTTGPMGKFLLVVLSGVAELEREMIRERVKDGLERAKAEGTKLGRPKLKINEKDVRELYAALHSERKVAEKMGISSSTVHRILAK
ncbi:MAG: recombinase family protein [Candidatus Thermoplasmatota archaeon]